MTGQRRPAGHDRLVTRRIGAGQLTHDPSTGTPRPPSSHLDMGPGAGCASCRLVGDADPDEVMNEGAGDYLYVLHGCQHQGSRHGRSRNPRIRRTGALRHHRRQDDPATSEATPHGGSPLGPRTQSARSTRAPDNRRAFASQLLSPWAAKISLRGPDLARFWRICSARPKMLFRQRRCPEISKCPENLRRWADYEIRRSIGRTLTR